MAFNSLFASRASRFASDGDVRQPDTDHGRGVQPAGQSRPVTVDYVDREVDGSLSGGEIKRVEIASVLARGTRLSIFDEPEAGIDLWSFNGLISAFEALKESRHAMIIISHQERIIDIADDIMVMAEGSIRLYGPRDEVQPLLLESDVAGYCPVGRKEPA